MADEPVKLRPVIYVQRRRKGRADVMSGIIYTVAVVAMVAGGAIFYGAYRRAQQEANAGYGVTDLPGGARVIGVMTSSAPTAAQAPAEPQPHPAETPKPEPQKAPSDLAPIVVAVAPRSGQMPDIRAVPRVPWGSTRGDVMNPLRVKAMPVADTVVVADTPYRDRNGGSLPQLALGGAGRIVLARFDLSQVAGWTVVRAVWHAKVVKDRLAALSFSAIPAEWQEGGGDFSAAAGIGATYLAADGVDTPWTRDGLPVPALLRGHGGSRVCFAEPDNPENQTGDWVAYELRPEIAQALVSGAATGLGIMDEKGQLGLDAAIASREDVEFAHYLELDGRAMDLLPPSQIEGFYAYAHPDLRGKRTCGALITWLAPGDDEMQGQAFRYDVRCAARESAVSFDDATRVAPERLPEPLPAGHEEQLVVDGLEPETPYVIFIRASDETGQFGPVSETSVTTAPPMILDELVQVRSFDGAPADLAMGQVTLEVFDELRSPEPEETRTSFLWDKASRSIHLSAARGDVATFVLRFRSKAGALPAIRVEAQPILAPGGDASGTEATFYEIMSDVLEPSSGDLQPDPRVNQRTMLVEIPVASEAKEGMYRSKLKITVPGKPEANINVFLPVVDVQLSDPEFTLEFATGVRPAAGDGETAGIALARAHRALFMPVPHARGDCPAPLAPPVSGSDKDLIISSWKEWDARYAAVLGETERYVILPVFEGWPKPFVDGYTCADQEIRVGKDGRAFNGSNKGVGGCLAAAYAESLAYASAEFGRHFKDTGRDNLDGHIWFLSEPSADYSGYVPPWNLGRPGNRDDYAALAALAEGVMGGAHLWRGGRPVVRADVPDARVLDDTGSGLFSILAVSDTNLCLWPLLRERTALTGEKLWLETGDPQPGADPAAYAALAIGAFLAGAEGWTIRNPPGAGPLAILAKAPKAGLPLKWLRRIQADIDLLAQLQAQREWTRDQLSDYIAQYISIEDFRPAANSSNLRVLRQATMEALAKMPQ